MRHFFALTGTFLFSFLVLSAPAHAQLMTPDMLAALNATAAGAATEYQRALLFANNNVVNAAALNGEIPDNLYQAAQGDFAATNRRLAGDAAASVGAEFSVQQSSGTRFSPGTDSDFITVVHSPDQVAGMQNGYNQRINQYLADAGVATPPRNDWHNALDTDFMADPRNVTAQQFNQIAEMNNDAYRLRNAAEYERLSRSGGKVTAANIRDYGIEMQEFAAKKQQAVTEMLQNPEAFADPLKRAELHRLLAQEQKYISRIEASVDALRAQEGLPPLARASLAQAGAVRAPGNFLNSAHAGSVGANSLTNAVDDLVATISEVSVRNPAFGATAADDIAQLVSRLPAADQGRIIEAIRLQHGPDFAQEVAAAARQQHGLGAADDLADAARAGGALAEAADDISMARRAANAGLAILDGIGRVANGIEVAGDILQMRDYYNTMRSAMDPNITDAEAEARFARMADIARGLAGSASFSALLEANPTLAAAFGSWTISYEGTGWILRNTVTGQAVNRAAIEVFDQSIQAGERASENLTEYFGGESERMQMSELERDILDSYIQAVREGRITLNDGVTMRDIYDSTRRGEPMSVREAMVTRGLEPLSAITGEGGYIDAAAVSDGGNSGLVCDPSLWNGTWSTGWGDMTLNGGGGGVEGNYPWDQGHVSGTLDATGCIFTGYWDKVPSRGFPNDKGKVILTLSPDGSGFTGVWGYGPDDVSRSDWSSSRSD